MITAFTDSFSRCYYADVVSLIRLRLWLMSISTSSGRKQATSLALWRRLSDFSLAAEILHKSLPGLCLRAWHGVSPPKADGLSSPSRRDTASHTPTLCEPRYTA